jgi:CRISPR/Cas system CSM-associated protein Csm3 (group 7 of RAMP superfamily)
MEEKYDIAGPGGVRALKARWVVTGDLCLTSAAHLGNGEPGDIVDMPISRAVSLGTIDAEPVGAFGPPLLTGSSLAGGLRAYLTAVTTGVLREEEKHSVVEALFGSSPVSSDADSDNFEDEGSQSPIITFDSIGCLGDAMIETRDGVRIDPKRGIATETAKFDYEVIPPGTVFPIRVDLLVDDSADEGTLTGLLICVIEGLQQGAVPIGAKKSKGLGACRVQNWYACRFDLKTREGWLAWLMSDHRKPIDEGTPCHQSIREAIEGLLPPGISPSDFSRSVYANDVVQVSLELRFRGGLLVRKPQEEMGSADVGHLRSAGKPVLPGTSLAGALRARARRIANIVRQQKGDADIWVERLFGSQALGPGVKRPMSAARIRVSEALLRDASRLRVTRIKIDRFTGGAMSGALLEEEPEYGGKVDVNIEVFKPQPGEVGFLLLLIKDLISGDLAVGGAGFVGRGVVMGKARINVNGRTVILDCEGKTQPGDTGYLNRAVEEFWNERPISGGDG